MVRMTDNLYEFRNYILEYLIEKGYKYIARDKDGALFAYPYKIIKKEGAWIFDSTLGTNKYKDISLISALFTDIEWEDVEPFKIPYTNWDDVLVDTKVIVVGLDSGEWNCHFCKKLNDKILVFRDGKTSWTTDDVIEVGTNNARTEELTDINVGQTRADISKMEDDLRGIYRDLPNVYVEDVYGITTRDNNYDTDTHSVNRRIVNIIYKVSSDDTRKSYRG